MRAHRETRSRRDFLKAVAITAAAASSAPLSVARAARLGRGNALPGRIVLYQDSGMDGHLANINRDRVEDCVHHAVRMLTGIDDTAAAFESLFPGLHSGSLITIKVNILAPNDTRWEVVRGIVSGLSMMLGGTYDVSQVTMFDKHNMATHGYVPDQFTFNGNCPAISSVSNCHPSYYAYGSHLLSNYLLDCDYVINVPVLKSHTGYAAHEISTAFKSHYGSICPSSLCNNIPGMLTVNADPNIKDKTCLVITSALRGTWDGGPWTAPQNWNTHPDGTPNMLFVTTDPTTNGYWCRDMINAERIARGYGPFTCAWVEESAGDPYYLGVAEPNDMTVLYHTASDVPAPSEIGSAGTFMAASLPNPCRDGATLRFRLAHAGNAAIRIVDATGRVRRDLKAGHFAAGHNQLRWDGRDDQGRRVTAGTYFARLKTRGAVSTRAITVAE